jgi:hypothetical protein
LAKGKRERPTIDEATALRFVDLITIAAFSHETMHAADDPCGDGGMMT